MEGWVFDLYSQSPDKMIVWLKTRDNGTVKLVDRWRPSFYVAGKPGDLDQLGSRLGTRLVDHRIEEWYERVDSQSKSRVLRVFYSNHYESDRLKRLILRLGRDGSRYRMYNLDVPPDQLYFYEKDLYPLAHVQTHESKTDGGVDWNLLDSSYDTDYCPLKLQTVNLEVETADDNSAFLKFNIPIGRIEINSRSESFTIDSGSEEEKLLELMKYVQALDPDVVITPQGDSSQLPYLGWRAKANHLSHEFYLGRESRQKVPEKQEGQSYFSYGRIYYRSGPIRLLGRFHLDRENAFVYDDCGLDGLFELSRCCRIPLHRASRSTIGTGMTSLQMYTAYKDGFLIPWRKDTPEDFKTVRELLIGDRGGFIYEPQTGLHEHVGELDFSSLYPMLMLTENVSQETIRCRCCPKSLERIPELDWNICNRKMGIVPKSLQILLMKRQVYKHLRKMEQSRELQDVYKQRSDALKWILVCCLPPESPVLLKQNGRVGYLPIGKIVDSLLGDKVGIVNCPIETYVAGVSHDLKAKFCRVGKLIKVSSPDTLLKVSMDDGRQVVCTPDHPFYVLREGRLVEVEAEDLVVENDFVPVAKRAPPPDFPLTENRNLELLSLVNAQLSHSEKGLWYVKTDRKGQFAIESRVENRPVPFNHFLRSSTAGSASSSTTFQVGLHRKGGDAEEDTSSSLCFSGPSALPFFQNPFLNRFRSLYPYRNRNLEYPCGWRSCRHLIVERFPTDASGLKGAVAKSRNIRSISLKGEVQSCPVLSHYLLERISQGHRFQRLQKVHSRLTRLLKADVGFAMVKSVERVESHTRYVYCFQLVEDEFPAFFTGDGAVLVHNCFGYLGFKNARFGKIDAHMAVCALSRDVLTKTATFVQEKGYDLLHGIVDSTWLKKEGASSDDYERLARELGDHFQLPLSFEGIYRWIVFLPSKVYPNRPVLNRYYGVFSDGTVKVRGIALRRHDSPVIVKKLQTDVLGVLTGAGGVEKFKGLLPETIKVLRAYVKYVKSGGVPAEDLVIRKNLSKEPAQYSHRVPQAIAAQQLRESGFDISAGQTVGYVILDSGNRTTNDIAAAALLDENVTYDVQSYISLLADGFAEILSPLGFTKNTTRASLEE